MSIVTPSRPSSTRPAAPRSRSAPPAPRAATIDPFRVLRRHLVLLIASAIFGGCLGAGAYVALLYLFPLSTGEVLFEVKPGVRKAGDVAVQDPLSDEDVYRIAKTQLVLMISREVLTNAVNDPDVQGKTEWFRTKFIDEDGTPLVAEAVDELDDDLGTSVMRGTQLFNIKWSAHNAADVPIVLNAVAHAYMDKRRALDNVVYNHNLELFNRQAGATNREIKDLDQEIQTFIIDADITSLEDPRYHQTSIAMKALIAQITGAQQALSIAQSGYLQVAAKLEGTMEPSAADMLEAEMDFAVRSHITIVENLKFQLRAAQGRFGAGHPKLQQAEGMLAAAEAERKAKTDEIIRRNLNAKLKTFGSQIETYQRMLEQLEAENEAKGKQLSELAAQQSAYEALRERRGHLESQRDADRQLIKEIQLMRLRTDAQRIAIAQDAHTPRERSFPKPEIMLPLGVMLMLGVTVGILFLREITDQRIKSASDLQILPGAHLLGVIPDVEEDPTGCEAAELVIRRHPTSVLAESYRQTCTPLTKAIDRAGHQTLVLIGGLPGAGTTTVAGNLAEASVATGRNVLIVDTNFRRPRLGEVMGIANDEIGLGDLLAGATTLDEAIVATESGVHVMVAGTPANRVIDRINSERFDSMVAELRSRFEIILFDAPPAVVAGDAMMLAHRLDAAVLVVRANQEQRGLVGRLMSQLADANCDLLGIVLNRPLMTAGGYFKKNFETMAAYAGVAAPEDVTGET